MGVILSRETYGSFDFLAVDFYTPSPRPPHQGGRFQNQRLGEIVQNMHGTESVSLDRRKIQMESERKKLLQKIAKDFFLRNLQTAK